MPFFKILHVKHKQTFYLWDASNFITNFWIRSAVYIKHHDKSWHVNKIQYLYYLLQAGSFQHFDIYVFSFMLDYD